MWSAQGREHPCLLTVAKALLSLSPNPPGSLWKLTAPGWSFSISPGSRPCCPDHLQAPGGWWESPSAEGQSRQQFLGPFVGKWLRKRSPRWSQSRAGGARVSRPQMGGERGSRGNNRRQPQG